MIDVIGVYLIVSSVEGGERRGSPPTPHHTSPPIVFQSNEVKVKVSESSTSIPASPAYQRCPLTLSLSSSTTKQRLLLHPHPSMRLRVVVEAMEVKGH
jgi:hypothetical protein